MNDSFDDFFLFIGIVWYNISVSVDINQLPFQNCVPEKTYRS